jgi:hypothetical protein
MLEDESAAVQWLAVGTFRRIGAGVADAVPVLLRLRAKGTPAMLVTRATACLGYVGPAAVDAVPVLKAAFTQAPDNMDTLEALWGIVPDDPEVSGAVLAGVFSSNFPRYLATSELLRHAGDPFIDRVFAEIAERARASDPDSRTAATRLLMKVASKRPTLTVSLLRELLKDPAAPQAWHAVSAVRELPAPRPADLVDAVVRVAADNDPGATLRALEVLVDLGAEASGAQDTFLRVITLNVGAHPVAGEDGWPASSLGAAAKGLAQACPTDRAVEPLLTWMWRVMANRSGSAPRLSWYPVGKVVEALAALAPSSQAVHEVILAAVARARTCIDEDESAVLDFDRSVRRAFERLSNRDEMFAKAEKLGMPRLDPYAE